MFRKKVGDRGLYPQSGHYTSVCFVPFLQSFCLCVAGESGTEEEEEVEEEERGGGRKGGGGGGRCVGRGRRVEDVD